MLDGALSWGDGEVRLGGELLPGSFLDMNIRGEVRFDESQQDSQSGRHKTPLGYQDADITLTLELLCDADGDCYSKLKQLNKVFKSDRRANPKVYAVANRHCAARGIRNVVFSELSSFESDQDDVITATLSFVEHLPPVIKRERQAAASRAAAARSGSAPAVQATPAASAAVVSDPDNPFMAGLAAGGR